MLHRIHLEKTHLRYRFEPGPPGQPCVLFLHPAGGSSLNWHAQLEALRGLYPLLAPDLGGVRAPEDGLAGRVPLLLDFLDALEAWEVVVVGHSMGGALAQLLALEAPERVRGLVLVATGLTLPIEADYLATVRHDWSAFLSLMAEKAFSPATPPREVERIMKAVALASQRVMVADLTATSRFDLHGATYDLNCPTLVIAGADDGLTPPSLAEELAATIPHARLEILPNTGHMIPQERPALLSRLLVDFLRQVR